MHLPLKCVEEGEERKYIVPRPASRVGGDGENRSASETRRLLYSPGGQLVHGQGVGREIHGLQRACATIIENGTHARTGHPASSSGEVAFFVLRRGGGLSAASRRCLRSLRVVVSSALLELCVLADPSSFGHLHCKGADKCCNLLLRALRMCISQHHLCAMSVDRTRVTRAIEYFNLQ